MSEAKKGGRTRVANKVPLLESNDFASHISLGK